MPSGTFFAHTTSLRLITQANCPALLPRPNFGDDRGGNDGNDEGARDADCGGEGLELCDEDGNHGDGEDGSGTLTIRTVTGLAMMTR